ncbi:MAG: electron transfer flavoprotein beta subunit/FixA family protein, partial [Planctomycetes bacterium]|nr:electron transfer flavoprotein beta subunit/FixA family protein [Planctomycetota bacterium]
QITYLEELIDLSDRTITVKRNIGNGWQEVKGTLPVLLTVLDEANEPRVPCAKRVMKYKKALSKAELNGDDAACKALEDKGLLIKQVDLASLDADLQWCGRDGSPTKVHRIQSVVLAAQETVEVDPTQESIDDMVHGLIEDHTIG